MVSIRIHVQVAPLLYLNHTRVLRRLSTRLWSRTFLDIAQGGEGAMYQLHEKRRLTHASVIPVGTDLLRRAFFSSLRYVPLCVPFNDGISFYTRNSVTGYLIGAQPHDLANSGNRFFSRDTHRAGAM